MNLETQAGLLQHVPAKDVADSPNLAWGPHVSSIMVQQHNRAGKHVVCTCMTLGRVSDEPLAHANIASVQVWAHLEVC